MMMVVVEAMGVGVMVLAAGVGAVVVVPVVILLCETYRLYVYIHSFHWLCRMQRFLAVLQSFFHSYLLYTIFFHPFPPTSLPSSLTSSCHLFLGLLLSVVVSKFLYDTFWGILFSSIVCTCPNQCNLFNFIVSVIAGF
jgi:hypothetical protein